MNKNNLWFFLICGLALLLFVVMVLAQLQQTPYLYNYDPWSHVFFTRFGEAQTLHTDAVEVFNGQRVIAYKSFLRTDVHLLATFTGIDIYFFYQYGSLFLRVLYLLMVINLVLIFTGKNKTVALLMTVFVGSSYYFVWRSYITFPENLGFLFQLLMFWAFEKFLKDKQSKYLFLLVVSLIGVIFIHPKSLFYSGFIYAAYGIRFLLERDWKTLLRVAGATLAGLILFAPVVWETILILTDTVDVNVGSDDPFTDIARNLTTYRPPTLATYEFFLGGLFIFLTLLGCMIVFRYKLKSQLQLLILLVLSFILSLGTRIQIFVPTDRMQAYLFIPVLAISAVGLDWLLKSMPNKKYYWWLVSSGMLIAVITIIQSPPWFGLNRGEVELTEFVNSALLSDAEPLLIAVGSEAEIVVTLLDDPGRICLDPEEVFFIESDDPAITEACANADYRIEDISINTPVNYLLLEEFGNYQLFIHSSLP